MKTSTVGNNILVNNTWIKEEVSREIKRYTKLNKRENLWNIAKAMLRKKFVTLNAYIKKEEKSQINNFNFPIKNVGKE